MKIIQAIRSDWAGMSPDEKTGMVLEATTSAVIVCVYVLGRYLYRFNPFMGLPIKVSAMTMLMLGLSLRKSQWTRRVLGLDLYERVPGESRIRWMWLFIILIVICEEVMKAASQDFGNNFASWFMLAMVACMAITIRFNRREVVGLHRSVTPNQAKTGS